MPEVTGSSPVSSTTENAGSSPAPRFVRLAAADHSPGTKRLHYVILYIVDACYSGFAVFNRSISDDLFEEMVRKPAIQILTAGRQQDEAQERAGHGVFTEALLRGLQGEAFAGKDWLSLEELGRGGSWDDEPKDLNVARRRSQDADERGDKIGFRCAKSAP
jgi:uncharacterized caspase-like protein